MTFRAPQAAAALTLFLASAGTAWACSLALWHSAHPENGATDVPLNARVSVMAHATGDGQLTLHRVLPDDTLEEVATTRTERDGSNGYPNVVLTPTALLQPQTEYAVMMEEAGGQVTRFTTGTSEDHTPPEPPTFELGEPVPYTPSGSSNSGGACWVDTGFATYSARSDGAATFTLFRERSILASGLPAEGSLSFECPAGTEQYEAELVAVDLAGNESEPVMVTIEEQCVRDVESYGCSAAGGASGLSGLALGALGLLGLRTSRRRTARRAG